MTVGLGNGQEEYVGVDSECKHLKLQMELPVWINILSYINIMFIGFNKKQYINLGFMQFPYVGTVITEVIPVI